MTQQTAVLDTIARDFGLSNEEVLRQSLKSFVEKKLREVGADYAGVCRKYNVSSVQEMETRYKIGALDESISREDFEKLDHLEFIKDELENAMRDLA